MYLRSDLESKSLKLLIVDDIIPTKFNFKASLFDDLFIKISILFIN